MLNENQDFISPFCPNPVCRFHHNPNKSRKWFIKYSSYFSEKENMQIQRFMCLECNKTFSERTFTSDYYLKLKLKYGQLFAGVKKGISVAQWAEALGHSVSVIENRLKRLGRWLVTRGYLSAHKLLRLRGWGLVRLGLFFRRLWEKAGCPEQRNNLKRGFLKQLESIYNVVKEELWTLLSWSYWLGSEYFYRPVFTYY